MAVVGRPNVGKSTLINYLLGEERLLTGPEAGITRNSIAVPLQWQGRDFLIYDTAGMRRRSKIDQKLEKLSVADALNAIRFAHVVVVLMDCEHAFEEQDLRIADLAEREGRALVIAMSKSDLMPKQADALKKLREETDHWLPQVKGVPVVAVSGDHRARRGPPVAGGDRKSRGLEQTRVYRCAQSLARRHPGATSATGGIRAPAEAQLHHPAEDPAAELHSVLHPRRCAA